MPKLGDIITIKVKVEAIHEDEKGLHYVVRAASGETFLQFMQVDACCIVDDADDDDFDFDETNPSNRASALITKEDK